jgi:parvulin-like peptidyl-prolyl isomerase
MKTALQIGNRNVPLEQVVQQLHDRQLLPQLLREIVVDETIAVAENLPQLAVDLDYSPDEFERLYGRIAEITPFQGMNEQQLNKIAQRTLKLQKFKQIGWGDRVRDYFEENQADLGRVKFSILQVEDGAIAQELFFRVQDAEQSFPELALQYSQGDTASKGGVVGPMFLRDLHPSLRQIISELQPGQLSSLFQIDGAYGFIRLDRFTPATFDRATYQILLDELFEGWIKSKVAVEIGGAQGLGTDRSLEPSMEPPTSSPPPEIVTPAAETTTTDEPEVTIVTEPSIQEFAEDLSTTFFVPDYPSIPEGIQAPPPEMMVPELPPLAPLDRDFNPRRSRRKPTLNNVLWGISIGSLVGVAGYIGFDYWQSSQTPAAPAPESIDR